MNAWVWGIYNLFDNGLIGFLLGKFEPSETAKAAMIGIGFALCVIVPYLLGSVNFALLISKHVYHDDIRLHGSGNAGSTNVLRTYGRKAAIVTFVGDGFKGVVSIVFASLLFGRPESEPSFIYLVTAAYLAAFFCVFGHVFPCFAHFKGGKGFATTALSIIALNPLIAAILIFVFFPMVLGTHYVSLGSVVTVLLYPILLASFDGTQQYPYGISVIFAVMIAALVTFAHRTNLKRVFNHTERKMFVGKSKKAQNDNSPSDKK